MGTGRETQEWSSRWVPSPALGFSTPLSIVGSGEPSRSVPIPPMRGLPGGGNSNDGMRRRTPGMLAGGVPPAPQLWGQDLPGNPSPSTSPGLQVDRKQLFLRERRLGLTDAGQRQVCVLGCLSWSRFSPLCPAWLLQIRQEAGGALGGLFLKQFGAFRVHSREIHASAEHLPEKICPGA